MVTGAALLRTVKVTNGSLHNPWRKSSCYRAQNPQHYFRRCEVTPADAVTVHSGCWCRSKRSPTSGGPTNFGLSSFVITYSEMWDTENTFRPATSPVRRTEQMPLTVYPSLAFGSARLDSA